MTLIPHSSITRPCRSLLLMALLCLFQVNPACCEEASAPTEPMTAEEAIILADETLTTPAGSFQGFLRVIETNSDVFVVGLLAATNNIVRPPLPGAPYCLRIWMDRNTREILPAPMTTSPGLTVSNVVDIVRNEDPHYSYGTNAPVVVTHLSETTIAKFPVKRPPSPGPGYWWLGRDFASIIWIDNATSNILFWLDGN